MILADFFSADDVVYRYSRAQAITDGILVDVTDTAREAGFRIPVAVTRALWDGYIVPPPLIAEDGQSNTGRLWDVLNVLRVAIRSASPNTDTLIFSVLFRMERQSETVRIKSVCGPGDAAEPVLTLMLPDED